MEKGTNVPTFPPLIGTNDNEKIMSEIVDNKSDESLDDKMVGKNVQPHPTYGEEEKKSLSYENDHKKENDVEPRRSKRMKLQQPVSYESFNKYLLSAESIISDVPSSFEEIKVRFDKENWEQAVKDELNSHFENETWHIVSKPKDKNIVDCRWAFTIKNDEFGNPSRYKARLVARGFTQQYLTDYDETYAPVARVTSFRFILAFANQHSLLVHHMDVKTAFLNGILKEEIYMRIPKGLKNDNAKVCKLNKAIYGLKQAARCWFTVFDQAMKERGFIHSEVDCCIYILDNGDINKNIYVCLYVDDLVIVTARSQVLFDFKQYLMSKFQMKDLGEIKYFIGIRMERSDTKMFLSQSAYIRKILNKYNMDECKPVSSPLPSKLNYEAWSSVEEYDAPCRNVIGCLMYIMICTRPDLSTCVNILSRYSNKTNKELWQYLKRVLRYLKGTIDLKKKTPYELWHDRKPILKYLKVFGSTVYIHNKTRSDKFDEKCWKGILVGYEPNGYRVCCVETGKFEIARDVVVDETNFMTSRPSEKSDEVHIGTRGGKSKFLRVPNFVKNCT